MKKVIFILSLITITLHTQLAVSQSGIALERPPETVLKEYKVGSLNVKGVTSNEITTEMTASTGYLSITNNGKESDTLVSFKSEITDSIQIYRSGKSSSKLLIKPGETIELNSEEFHIKFLDLKKNIEINEDFIVTLNFKKSGSVDIKFSIIEVAGLQTVPSLDIF